MNREFRPSKGFGVYVRRDPVFVCVFFLQIPVRDLGLCLEGKTFRVQD